MKLRHLPLLLLAIIAATLTSCSQKTDINNLIDTLNQYADSFDKVTTPQEFNDTMIDFNKATAAYADSETPVNEADRQAIIKAIDTFSASANKAMSNIYPQAPMMTPQQRQAELDNLATDLADAKTLGDVIRICMQE